MFCLKFRKTDIEGYLPKARENKRVVAESIDSVVIEPALTDQDKAKLARKELTIDEIRSNIDSYLN